MRTFFFILFIILNCILIFKVNQYFRPKTAAITYGISLVAIPLLMLAGIYVLRLLNFHADKQFQDIYFAVMLSFTVLLLLNLVVLLADVVAHKLIDFQETTNTANTDKNPVRFARGNQSGIQLMYRLFFFACSILMFYGIWLGKK